MKFLSTKVVPIVLFVCTLGIGCYNFNNNAHFLDMSIGTMLTILVAISIAYIATQKMNDDREAKKRVEYIIEKIQAIVQNEHFYIIPNPDDDISQKAIREELLLTNKRLKNLIEILKKYGEIYKFGEDIAYIDDNFKKYREIVEDIMMDLEALAKTKNVLQNWANNIDSKCEEIICNLYGL